MLVDFAGIKIFDAITVEANILLSQKAANIFNTQACLVQDSNTQSTSQRITHPAIFVCFSRRL